MNKHQVKLACAFAPNVVYTADYVSQYGSGSMVRFQIVALEDGRYNVQKVDSTIHTFNRPYELLASLQCLSKAKDRVRQEGLAIEQNDFDFFDDCDYELYDCTSGLNIGQCGVMDAFSFHSAYHSHKNLVAQPLAGGFHAILTVNQYGHLHLLAPGSSHKVALSDCSEAHQIKRISSITGFRGAVLEVMICNHKIHILDAAYFSDRWLSEMTFSQRMAFLNGKLLSHGIDTQLIVKPRILAPIEWLKLHAEGFVKGYMVRALDAKPIAGLCVSAPKQFQYVITQSKGRAVKLVTSIQDKTNVLCGDSLGFLFDLRLPTYICKAFKDVLFLAECKNPNRSPIVLNQEFLR